MVNIDEIIDLTNLSWTKSRQSFSTAGSYLKSYSYVNGKKVYYKLSYFDDINGIFGYESFNEIIADRLLSHLGFSHLEYNLVKGKIVINNKEYVTYLNYTYDFKRPNETKMTLENFYELNKENNEDIISFMKRYNFLNEMYHMIIIDYLIMNRDRHGANIEVLYNTKTKEYRLAPLFDHGLSLLSPSYLLPDIEAYDIFKNKRVNSYIGSSSLEENIEIVPKSIFPKINLDLDNIFQGIITNDNEEYMLKAKQLLQRRWKELEDIFYKK